jgi:hypothetical protein
MKSPMHSHAPRNKALCGAFCFLCSGGLGGLGDCERFVQNVKWFYHFTARIR